MSRARVAVWWYWHVESPLFRRVLDDMADIDPAAMALYRFALCVGDVLCEPPAR